MQSKLGVTGEKRLWSHAKHRFRSPVGERLADDPRDDLGGGGGDCGEVEVEHCVERGGLAPQSAAKRGSLPAVDE